MNRHNDISKYDNKDNFWLSSEEFRRNFDKYLIEFRGNFGYQSPKPIQLISKYDTETNFWLSSEEFQRNFDRDLIEFQGNFGYQSPKLIQLISKYNAETSFRFQRRFQVSEEVSGFRFQSFGFGDFKNKFQQASLITPEFIFHKCQRLGNTT